MNGLHLQPVLPALLLAVTGVIVLLSQAFTPKGKTAPAAMLSLVGLVGALLAVLMLAQRPGPALVTGGSVSGDAFSLFLHVLLIAVAILVVLVSPAYLRATGGERGEYYSLVLFSLVGMLGLVSCLELVSLFVALEIMSVAVYALCGSQRGVARSQEAAMKYFITGAFSSSFFLYGVALLYGASGSTMLASIGAALQSPAPGARGLALVGLGFLLVGFGFKVASVPFHMWAPDVYEGAPTTVTSLMSAGVKAAAFGAFLRVFLVALPALAADWRPAVAVLAVLTMVVGNMGALAQSNLKRMLAYSSIAHAGYLMSAFVGGSRAAVEAVLFYLVAYAAVNLGGFAILAALAKGGREPLLREDIAGMGARRPALAAAFTVFLISLTGIPVSAGFVGKFYLFTAAVDAGYVTLAVVGMLMSVVSAYYYLRLVVAMYMEQPAGADEWASVPVPARLAIAVSVATVLCFGVYPAPLLAWARLAAQSLP